MKKEMAPKVSKFGGPHCWSGRRGGGFRVEFGEWARELLGVGIFDMDIKKKIGGDKMLRKKSALMIFFFEISQ